MKTTGVVAFAFGVPETILSNRRIAEIASKNARELNGRVYTQLDIRIEDDVPVEYTEEEPGNPPPTLRIARGAVQWAKRRGLTELWVVAAKPHLWRALRDLQQAVREDGVQIEVRVCKEIERYPEDSWFCPDSVQKRVRSREAWNKRECIIKLMPFFVYKRVAS
ncbi:MAG TPA: hypothetical protein VNK70_00670 [Candidatus Paceibacterota bacterium]|nr:hypothetical protein [Candidatus Paceibacterota bacterium]